MMVAEKDGLLTKIEQEIKPSPMSEPSAEGECSPPLLDGYERRTKKQKIRYDASYYKKKKKSRIQVVLIVTLVVLLGLAVWKLGYLQSLILVF